MYRYDDIRTVHLEITAKCQAACLQCDRNINGGELNPNISLSELKLDDVKKIFEPKFTTKTSGMGLGLPMVKNIIEVYNGKISFNTSSKNGTVFKISFPKK